MSQRVKVSELKPYPKNKVFFDDIEGDAWSEFIESVKTSGVIEPIVVTSEKVIVSGHQRVRACNVLGIDEVEAEVKIYDSEDEVLKQLIETNIRQRGIGNANPVKFGRCLKELERIYGIQHGNNQHSSRTPQNAESSKSQEDLASELGISVDTLNRYKKLADAIPEIQSLVETGKVTKTVALGLMRRLTEDEQKQLVEMLPKSGEPLSSHEVKFYENRIKALSDSNDSLKGRVVELERNELELKSRIQEIEEQDAPEDGEKLEREAWNFNLTTFEYIETAGKYLWVAERVGDLQEYSRAEFVNAVRAADAFIKRVLDALETGEEPGAKR